MRKKLFLVWCLGCLASCLSCKGKPDHRPIVLTYPEEPMEMTTVEDCERCIILAEQSEHRVAIVDTEEGKIIWEWSADQSNVRPEDVAWFNNISDAKIVYDGKYILTCASGGGVALIRIADKKTLFYAYAGGNTHSVELLPDGNMVSASSTGNFLTLFKVDTLHYPDGVYKQKVPIESGHNVVWDIKKQLLWSAGGNTLYAYEYNFNCDRPDLMLKDSLQLPGDNAHDLFPVYGKNALWLTNTTGIYTIDLEGMKVRLADSEYHQHIKSVSSGPDGFPMIIMKPKEKWWSDEVIDMKGNSVFQENGLKIYKARWVLPNRFSYPENDAFRVCN